MSGVDPKVLISICKVESDLNVTATNFNDGGSHSHGLCQIKLSTARMVGFTGDVKLLYQPEINAIYASKYLKYQLDRYSGDYLKAVSAYNAGTYTTKNKSYVKKVMNK